MESVVANDDDIAEEVRKRKKAKKKKKKEKEKDRKDKEKEEKEKEATKAKLSGGGEEVQAEVTVHRVQGAPLIGACSKFLFCWLG